ncbi:hypothetical protein NA78x_003366 [Anatilimnocola sp. NA78]|uniref:hypothetical protein n=1 Tax=Anatilimnocola sp. NA78 TaxID=3415683 RepID=UPI003CE5BA82
MPEMISAHITLGGCVLAELVPQLCTLISQEDLTLEWGGNQFLPQTAEDLLSARQPEQQHIQLFADEASWGQFAALEQFLIEQEIPFDRHHDAKYEIASTTLYFRPESGRQEYLTNGDEVICEVGPLRALATSLRHLRDQLSGGQISAAQNMIASSIDLLDAHLPAEVPPLPPFGIVGLTADKSSKYQEA